MYENGTLKTSNKNNLSVIGAANSAHTFIPFIGDTIIYSEGRVKGASGACL